MGAQHETGNETGRVPVGRSGSKRMQIDRQGMRWHAETDRAVCQSRCEWSSGTAATRGAN